MRAPAVHILLLLALAAWTPAGWSASPDAPLVVVATAETSAVIDEVPLSGTVTSPRAARLSTELSGLVDALMVDAGDRVAKDDVLLVLDGELERLALDAASAEEEQARQELADARRRLGDAQTLARKKTISSNELQSIEAEVLIAGAALQRHIANRKQQEARLRRHTLSAPFAGIISRKLTEIGEWLDPGDAVFELVATDDLRIDFQAPQAAFGKIGRDAAVSVSLESAPGRMFDGHITTIVPISDPQARTFLIRVILEDGAAAVMPGMSAGGVLRLPTGERKVVVSRDALLRHPDGRVTVWVLDDNGGQTKVSERRVHTGLAFDGRVAIDTGLDAGARVVVQGNEGLHEGQSVRVVEPE